MEKKPRKGRTPMECKGVSVHNPNKCRRRKACTVAKGKFRHYCRRIRVTQKKKPPSPKPKSPSPKLKSPSPKLKSPSPKPKSPSPKPKSHSLSLSPLLSTPSPLLSTQSPLLSSPSPLPKILNTQKIKYKPGNVSITSYKMQTKKLLPKKVNRPDEALKKHIINIKKGRDSNLKKIIL